MINLSIKKVKKLLLVLLLAFGAVTLLQYYPVLKSEIKYLVGSVKKQEQQEVALTTSKIEEEGKEKTKTIIPVNKEFGIVIPKIGVNMAIIPQVDPFNSKEYQKALTKGIAHVKDMVLPNAGGNIVLFAHSSDNFYNANRYNAVFYLLNKLNAGNEIVIVYDNKLYKYSVTEKSIVGPEDMKYMERSAESKLTLITCWPPGTTLKRLVVVAKEIQ